MKIVNGLVLGLLTWTGASAETLKVPEVHPTIQSAIEAASPGDVISIAGGTYEESIDLLGKSIVLRPRSRSGGAGGPVVLTSGEQGGTLVRCVSGEGPPTRLQNLIFRGGLGDRTRYQGDVTVGGAMILLHSSPTIENCRFEDNRVNYNGGGVYARNSNSQFFGCQFIRNSAEKGGGVFSSACRLVFDRCTFEQNRAMFGGGAMSSENRSENRVLNSMFAENRASFNGGGLYDYDSATTVTDSIFLNNIGAYKGGAAYHGWRSRGRLDDSNSFRTPNDDIAGSARSIDEANPLGACFVSEGCVQATEESCLAGGGIWSGPGSRCDEAKRPEGLPQRAGGDLNGDGSVDVRDMAILLSTWGRRDLKDAGER